MCWCINFVLFNDSLDTDQWNKAKQIFFRYQLQYKPRLD